MAQSIAFFALVRNAKHYRAKPQHGEAFDACFLRSEFPGGELCRRCRLLRLPNTTRARLVMILRRCTLGFVEYHFEKGNRRVFVTHI